MNALLALLVQGNTNTGEGQNEGDQRDQGGGNGDTWGAVAGRRGAIGGVRARTRTGTGGTRARGSGLTVGVTALGRRRRNGRRSTTTVELVTLDVTLGVQLGERVTRQVTSSRQVETTSNSVQFWEGSVVKVTVNVDGTANGLQLVKVREGLQVLVVNNVQSTANGLQLREVKLLQVIVLGDGKRLTNGLQLLELEALESVLGDGERTVNGGQVSSGKRRNLLENDIVSRLQLVQGNLNLVGVVVDRQGVGNSLQSRVDGLNVTVVVNVKHLQSEDVDTVQRVQTSVGNGDGLSRGDTRSQTGLLQSWQRVKVQSTNGGQLSQVGGSQDSGLGEGQLTRNQLQVWGVKDGSLGTVDLQVTVELLDTSQVDLVNVRSRDENVTDSGSTSLDRTNLAVLGGGEVIEGTGAGDRGSRSGQCGV